MQRILTWLPAVIARPAGRLIDRFNWTSLLLTRIAVNGIVGTTRTRPHPWSTLSDYVSWQALTDRSFQGRHLPAFYPANGLPPWERIADLFARPDGEQLVSDKSTCLFPAFAQYLTDGFIRTDVSLDDDPVLRRRKTTTNHEIDLCPLYGRTTAQTRLLRTLNESPGHRGQLKSQQINGEEYAPSLYEPSGMTVRPEFAASTSRPGLDHPLGFDEKVAAAARATAFAFGGDRANATPAVAMVNTLFLREHNRLAAGLVSNHPDWDDERVFQTARNILIVMFIKIVVEEYINHITPLPFQLRADPTVAWKADWNRPNWITAEFSLVYRWHSLIPDTMSWPGGAIPMQNFARNNQPLTEKGLAAVFEAIATQPAGALSASNTNAFLLMAEEKAVDQGRANSIAPFNHYCRAFGRPPATRFEDFGSDPRIHGLLGELYATPEDVEFYVGLFAEDRVKNSPLPPLLLIMVAVDAFTQALTNPLLSEHVHGKPEVFTAWGLRQIEETANLEDIMRRNVPVPPARTSLRMTRADWRYR